MLWSSTTGLVALATFGTYTALGNRLALDVALPVLSLITILQFPLAVLPWMLISSISFRIALARLEKFLKLPSIVDLRTMNRQADDKSIAVDALRLRWTPDRDVLAGVSFQVPAGGLVALVGPVGSGKSSLVAALLAELEMAAGSVRVPQGRVGYVPQQACIFNASLRQNIIVGSPFERKRYERALAVSGLEADIAALPAGDGTEIGERGINLSGGQKQRVCIARAVYSEAAFFLLDDPLSAVDSHVAQHIFSKCINGAMAGSTRLLVTHRLDLIRDVPHIIVLGEGGIVAQGTYSDLLACNVDMGIDESQGAPDPAAIADASSDEAPVSHNLADPSAHAQSRKGSEEAGADDIAAAGREGANCAESASRAASGIDGGMGDRPAVEGTELIKEEERETGLVKRQTYEAYLASIGQEMLVVVGSLGFGSQLARVLIGWWIAQWAADDSLATPQDSLRRLADLLPMPPLPFPVASPEAAVVLWGQLNTGAVAGAVGAVGAAKALPHVAMASWRAVLRRSASAHRVHLLQHDDPDAPAPPPASGIPSAGTPRPPRVPPPPRDTPAPPARPPAGTEHSYPADAEEEGLGEGQDGKGAVKGGQTGEEREEGEEEDAMEHSQGEAGVVHGKYILVYLLLTMAEAVMTFGRDVALTVGRSCHPHV